MLRVLGRLLRWLALLLLGLVLASVGWAAAYRWIDPPTTFLMLRDRAEGRRIAHEWVPLDAMAPALPRAVIAAEDSRFCQHRGFDLQAIEAARKANAQGRRLRGASTISQQTAKNVFLWPARTWLRKGLEAWFTLLIEQLWGKRRIMEVYLNVIETGPATFGMEAAARRHFGKPASAVSEREAARLAAILPQPIERSASAPGRFTRRYARTIDRRIDVVRADALDACLRRAGA
jgi:monofunctional biosynthetic peptidoglycan transglycosylase